MNYKAILGIMVCSVNNKLFYEKNFYKYLQALGSKKSIIVYVFYPDSINWEKGLVNGYHYNFAKKSWENKSFSLPNFIYDRCFYVSRQKYLKYKPYINKIKQKGDIFFLGNGLKGKWEVHEILSKNPNFVNFLPKTEKLVSNKQLMSWLNIFPIILKPIGGSHGAGVIKISKQNTNYSIVGRDYYNKKINYLFKDNVKFIKWINFFVNKKSFIIQQYLNLNTLNNQPYDIRVLIQKNQNGAWETTGMSVRLGDKDNITSNLHGGGKVEQLASFLVKEFGKGKAEELKNEIDRLVTSIPDFIEEKHGNLFELGIDLGIDRNAKVWIIEVNSKPGRRVFTLLNDKEKSVKALSQPIFYTEYLANTEKKERHYYSKGLHY